MLTLILPVLQPEKWSIEKKILRTFDGKIMLLFLLSYLILLYFFYFVFRIFVFHPSLNVNF